MQSAAAGAAQGHSGGGDDDGAAAASHLDSPRPPIPPTRRPARRFHPSRRAAAAAPGAAMTGGGRGGAGAGRVDARAMLRSDADPPLLVAPHRRRVPPRSVSATPRVTRASASRAPPSLPRARACQPRRAVSLSPADVRPPAVCAVAAAAARSTSSTSRALRAATPRPSSALVRPALVLARAPCAPVADLAPSLPARRRVGTEGQAPPHHWHWPHAAPEGRLAPLQERRRHRRRRRVVRPPRAPTDELPSPAASARAPPPPARSRRSKLLRPCEPLCPPRSRPYLPSPRLGLSRSPFPLDLALSPSSGITNLPPPLSPVGESASLLCVRSVLDGHWAGRKGDERGVGSRAGLGGRVGTERGARSERDVWVETGVVVVASCAALAVCERESQSCCASSSSPSRATSAAPLSRPPSSLVSADACCP